MIHEDSISWSGHDLYGIEWFRVQTIVQVKKGNKIKIIKIQTVQTWPKQQRFFCPAEVFRVLNKVLHEEFSEDW